MEELWMEFQLESLQLLPPPPAGLYLHRHDADASALWRSMALGAEDVQMWEQKCAASQPSFNLFVC